MNWRSYIDSASPLSPFLIVGALAAFGGIFLVLNNQKRIPEYRAAYERAPDEFLQAEKKRAEGFIKWYPITMAIVAGFIGVALLLYIFQGGAWGRAIGLAMLLTGLGILLLDASPG